MSMGPDGYASREEQLRRAREEIEELRASLPQLTPEIFRVEVDGVLARSTNPKLDDVAWSYIEGTITRRELRSDPLYREAVASYYRDEFARQGAAGVDFAAIRAEVRALVEEEDAANGTDLAAVLIEE